MDLLILTLTYIQAMTVHIYTKGRFSHNTAHSLYRILVRATSVAGVMKMRYIVPRVGIKPTSLTFWTIVLTFIPPKLPDAIALCTYICGSLPERSMQTTSQVTSIGRLWETTDSFRKGQLSREVKFDHICCGYWMATRQSSSYALHQGKRSLQ